MQYEKNNMNKNNKIKIYKFVNKYKYIIVI